MYVSIDIETTGLDPRTCQILEFAAIIDDNSESFGDLPVFHRYIKHDVVRGEYRALIMNQRILEALAQGEGIASWELARQFKAFLELHNLDGKIIVAGKNYAGFDAHFLNDLSDWDELIKTHHRVLDPAMLYWRPKYDGFMLPDTQTCMSRAGISGKVLHMASSDALVIIKLLRKYYDSRNQ